MSNLPENKKLIVLPCADEMKRRLIAVDDNSHFQEKFYPILLKEAGRKLFPSGVIMMLMLAINDYSKDLPPLVESLMVYGSMPEFISALVTDEEALKETLDFYMIATKQK